MSAPAFIEINGKLELWSELLQRRCEQRQAARIEQPALFELKEDHRPVGERNAADREHLFDRDG